MAAIENTHGPGESRAERIERLGRQAAAAEAPLLEELRGIGVDIPSVSSLQEKAAEPEYAFAIPLLLRSLDSDLPEILKSFIAQALGAPAASSVWDELVARYEAAPPGIVKDSLAFAVARGFNRMRVDRALQLVDDDTVGESRVMFIRDLKRIRDPRVLPFLESRRDDPIIGQEIRRALAGRSMKS